MTADIQFYAMFVYLLLALSTHGNSKPNSEKKDFESMDEFNSTESSFSQNNFFHNCQISHVLQTIFLEKISSEFDFLYMRNQFKKFSDFTPISFHIMSSTAQITIVLFSRFVCQVKSHFLRDMQENCTS